MNDKLPAKPPAGFERTRRRAEEYLESPSRMGDLLRRAREKAAQKRNLLQEVWEDLLALLRLLKAWSSGQYRGVAWQTMLLVTTAILYFVIPFDVIPDFIAMWGFLDDAAIIGYVVNAIRQELDRFLAWEGTSESEPDEQLPFDP